MNTIITPLIGGVLIGVSAGIYLLLNGRIMGVSGIVGGLFSKIRPSDWATRAMFIIGMLVAPWVYGVFFKLPDLEITSNKLLLIIAGLLVGIGSRLGSGCTSGHGVCGMGRFSKRSIVAVGVFMLAAIVTVLIQEHILA